MDERQKQMCVFPLLSVVCSMLSSVCCVHRNCQYVTKKGVIRKFMKFIKFATQLLCARHIRMILLTLDISLCSLYNRHHTTRMDIPGIGPVKVQMTIKTHRA